MFHLYYCIITERTTKLMWIDPSPYLIDAESSGPNKVKDFRDNYDKVYRIRLG